MADNRTDNRLPAKKDLVADWNHLMRVFLRPEDDASRQTLIKYMEQMLFGLHEFLKSMWALPRPKASRIFPNIS